MKEDLGVKLWRITMQKAGERESFNIVSVHKPILVFESYFGRLRRMFNVVPPRKADPLVFYLLRGEEGEVERAIDMHGFKLKTITEKQIILQVENPQNKNLYEISLFSSRSRGFLKRKYVFSKDRREAASFARQFKNNYHVNVRKAAKIDRYPIETVDKERIILNRQT